MGLVKRTLVLIALIAIICTCKHDNQTNVKPRGNIAKLRRVKRAKSPTLYYANSTSTFNCIIQHIHDVELNPGPNQNSPKCPTCEKTVKTNQHRTICEKCFSASHNKCILRNSKNLRARIPSYWTCPTCCLSTLPFFGCRDLDTSADTMNNTSPLDQHETMLNEKQNLLSFLHLNTQSLVSSVCELNLLIERYKFDIIGMSETWLHDNDLLIQHVAMPGYTLEYNNRAQGRGGGVGCYLRENIKYKRRKDIERISKIEHLWVQYEGRNKHSSLLIGIFYRSESVMPFDEWMNEFENVLSFVRSSAVLPLLITGDFNVNLLNDSSPKYKPYMDVLEQFNLEQVTVKPTRVTPTAVSLIDHIIVSNKTIVKYSDVLPCACVSDHDGPYVILNTKLPAYEPRYKYLRNERSFNPQQFRADVAQLPFSIIDSTTDPDEQLDYFNKLIRSCIDDHAPLRKVKVTRPPAPWIQDEKIQQLQKERNQSRYDAHLQKDQDAWSRFRKNRNDLKREIRSAKRRFYSSVFNSKNSKEVWKLINSVLHPPPLRIRAKPDELNSYFATTAHRILKSTRTPDEQTLRYINTLPGDPKKFRLKSVAVDDVAKIIRSLKAGSSTGADKIPIKFIKLVIDEIAAPLTIILNNFIAQSKYPACWKISRVCTIPKTSAPIKNDDYRPINILPALSKIYEKVVLQQLTEYIEAQNIYRDSIAGFRKGFSTGSALIRLRDDIRKAMNAQEITLLTLIDFSKAFETIDHTTAMKKLYDLGFSKSFIHWTFSYLSDRKQFTQIDADVSGLQPVDFGVPQGSILGPVLFNLYVNDIDDCCQSHSLQYADDTSIYESAKPQDIQKAVDNMNISLSNISAYARSNNLLLNEKKTVYMALGTSHLLQRHRNLSENVALNLNDKIINQQTTTKVLGVCVDRCIKWDEHVKNVLKSGYSKLVVLRKLKNFAPFKHRKMMAESLILSVIDYCDYVYSPLTQLQLRKLQKLQLSAASFVLRKYARVADLQTIRWLPIEERREHNLLKLAHKAMNLPSWPKMNTLVKRVRVRDLRDNENKLVIPEVSGTFQDSAARCFNRLPAELRSLKDYNKFSNNVKQFLYNKAFNN